MRHGFTLVETIVALVLVQFGLLAVAATSAIAVRDMAVAARATRAREAARERVEQLRNTACSGPVAGSRATTGFVEHWRVTADSALATIRDSVDYPLPRARRAHVVVAEKVLCG